MMNNTYFDFVSILNDYNISHGLSTIVEEKLSDASYDSEHDRRFISSIADLDTVSMDNMAHDVVRLVAKPDSKWNKDSPASVDSFLIDKDGKWYFIEFKNRKINKTKYKCIEKSYANIFWLIGILLEMRQKHSISEFDYANPLSFVKKNCIFILVIGNGCDDISLQKYREAKKAKLALPENFEFIQKLETYVFNKAFVYNETQFDELFVKTFQY